jgi:hypothetical protein
MFVNEYQNSLTMMKKCWISFILFCLLAMFEIHAQEKVTDYGVFSFDKKISLPGTPEYIYDNISGDITSWWDHSFVEDPKELYIEAKPGGGFYEIFDEEGNGAKHATVIYADRGKILRFEGPLGLSGMALQLVCTYTFVASGEDSTVLKLNVHGAGEVPEGIPAIVESVWHHFLFERFKPYIESQRSQ